MIVFGGLVVLTFLFFNWSSFVLTTINEKLAKSEGLNTLFNQLLIMLLMTIVVAVSFTLIATGLILKNKPVVGSCGGLANIEEGAPCKICGRTTTGDCLTPKTDS